MSGLGSILTMKSKLTQRIQDRRRRESLRWLLRRVPWGASSMVFARYATLAGTIVLGALYALGMAAP